MKDILAIFQEAELTQQSKQKAIVLAQTQLATSKSTVLQPLIDVWQALGSVNLNFNSGVTVQDAFVFDPAVPSLVFTVDGSLVFTDASYVSPLGDLIPRILALTLDGIKVSEPPDSMAIQLINWIAEHELVKGA
jgi:hypothetical protein